MVDIARPSQAKKKRIRRILYATAGLALPVLAITGYWIMARRPD